MSAFAFPSPHPGKPVVVGASGALATGTPPRVPRLPAAFMSPVDETRQMEVQTERAPRSRRPVHSRDAFVLSPVPPPDSVASSVVFPGGSRQLKDSRSSLYVSPARVSELAKELGLEERDSTSLAAEKHLGAHLGRLHQHTLEELKRQVHRLRKQHDELRSSNTAATLEVQRVQAELVKFERLAATERSDDSVRVKSKTEETEARVVECEANLEELEASRAVYTHMLARLHSELITSETEVNSAQAVLQDLKSQMESSSAAVHAALLQRKRTEETNVKLRMLLESQRHDRAMRLMSLEHSSAVQEHHLRHVTEREQHRQQIHNLPLGDLDEDSEERLKLLFLVRKAYSKMLQRKIQAEQKQCDSLESGFQTIRQATGLSAVEDIVKKFLGRHAAMAQLQRQAGMTRDRIDVLKQDNATLSVLCDDIMTVKGPTSDVRDTYQRVEAYERRMQQAEEACAAAKEKLARVCVSLDEMRSCLVRLSSKFPEDDEEAGVTGEPRVLASEVLLGRNSSRMHPHTSGTGTSPKAAGQMHTESTSSLASLEGQKSLEDMFVQLDVKVSYMMEYLQEVVEKEGQPPQVLYELGTFADFGHVHSHKRSATHVFGVSHSNSAVGTTHASAKLLKSLMTEKQTFASSVNVRVGARATTPSRSGDGSSLTSRGHSFTGSGFGEEDDEDDEPESLSAVLNVRSGDKVLDREGLKRLASMFARKS